MARVWTAVRKNSLTARPGFLGFSKHTTSVAAFVMEASRCNAVGAEEANIPPPTYRRLLSGQFSMGSPEGTNCTFAQYQLSPKKGETDLSTTGRLWSRSAPGSGCQ